MFRFFANQKYFKLYFSIVRCNNLRTLAKNSGMTIAHLSRVTDQLVKEGLLIKKPVGREVSIEYTEEGKKFNQILYEWTKLHNKVQNKSQEEKHGKTGRKTNSRVKS